MGVIRENESLRTGCAAESHNLDDIISECHTDDKGLFWLSSVLVIPGRSASGVDGACACAEQRGLCFTQRGGALPARGPGRGQEAVQRVLPAPTVKTANSRAGHSLSKRFGEETQEKPCRALPSRSWNLQLQLIYNWTNRFETFGFKLKARGIHFLPVHGTTWARCEGVDPFSWH